DRPRPAGGLLAVRDRAHAPGQCRVQPSRLRPRRRTLRQWPSQYRALPELRDAGRRPRPPPPLAATAARSPRLAAAVAHPEWAADPRLATNAARVVNREVVDRLVQAALGGESAEAWVARVRGGGGA